MQETQAAMALNEVAESIFQDHLQPDQNTQEKEVGASIKERTISPTDKVVSFQTTLGQTTKPKKKITLLVLFFQEIVLKYTKKSIRFSTKKWKRAAKHHQLFSACFQNCAFGALFRKEKKFGVIISKTKL